MALDAQNIEEIARRWEGVKSGYANLTFDAAKADMDVLLAAVRNQGALTRRIAELEGHVIKRNNDMLAFATEVARLANQKYADYM